MSWTPDADAAARHYAHSVLGEEFGPDVQAEPLEIPDDGVLIRGRSYVLRKKDSGDGIVHGREMSIRIRPLSAAELAEDLDSFISAVDRLPPEPTLANARVFLLAAKQLLEG